MQKWAGRLDGRLPLDQPRSQRASQQSVEFTRRCLTVDRNRGRATERTISGHSTLRTMAVPSLKMSTSAYAARPEASTPALFGRVMGLVAVTVGFATLGVWLGRNSGGATWFISWLVALACLFGLQFANAGQYRTRVGIAVCVWPVDRRERLDDGLLLLRRRSHRRPSGVRGDGAVRRSPRVRRVCGAPRPVVPLSVRVFWTAGTAPGWDCADLRAHLGRLHDLVARRLGRVRGSIPSPTSTACVMPVPTRRSRSPRASFSMS